jgi:methionine sulfoxide reductase catalytic subunit
MKLQEKRALRGEDIPATEITREADYRAFETLRRRGFLSAAGLSMLGAHLPAFAKNDSPPMRGVVANKNFTTSEALTSWDDVTSYNNFYEFGLDKDDPKAYAQDFNTSAWTIEIAGHCEIKGKFALTDVLKGLPVQERIYRHRCVEAWSMVVPWAGIPLADVLKRYKPTSKAKYVAFHTLLDSKQMPNQRGADLNWPYREGLRMDEAMNPLTLLVTGLYGRVLPNQNGAPIRLIVPWKYGFKGIKSIVKIEFVENQPFTSWSDSIPDEYGFYANVNPKVSHPRWSQASERRLAGSGILRTKRIDTQMFNGYGNFVAAMYKDMDLARYY